MEEGNAFKEEGDDTTVQAYVMLSFGHCRFKDVAGKISHHEGWRAQGFGEMARLSLKWEGPFTSSHGICAGR